MALAGVRRLQGDRVPAPARIALMLVYGDASRTERLGEKRASILAALAAVERMAPGIERHAALVAAFIASSELVQGLADAAFEEHGADCGSDAEGSGMTALMALATMVDASWRNGFATGAVPWPALEPLRGLDGAAANRTKEAEGYAFYALYPEAYLEAARRSGLGPGTTVIGIRSIGTGLAALVAAVLQAPLPVTVRPLGHPYRRELKIGGPLADDLAADPDRSFAVVDEGPGLSGSSFAAVADWLAARGVAHERIHFFPSHLGDPGPQASEAHRARWSHARRHCVSFEELFFDSDRRLEACAADLLGPLDGPLEDLSGGGWRRIRFPHERDWPAANVQQERRKFLARAGGVAWLLKFAGLGAAGPAKLARARRLHAAGFAVEIAGLRHGFLVERWMADAPSLDRAALDRAVLVERVGSYLGFRARAFPARGRTGARLDDLARMACHNAGEALGPEIAARLERRFSRAAELESRVRRVVTDNRLHAHEWLLDEGRPIKTDALDHAFGHDLVGCQDVAWDVAGAVAEFGLDSAETARLSRAIEREAGCAVDPDLVAFMQPCYLAFQLGVATVAADAVGGGEAPRLRREALRYGTLLARETAGDRRD
jgi:hypothetical protein